MLQRMSAKTVSTSSCLKVCHVHLLSIMSGPQQSTIELFKQLEADRYELHAVVASPGEFGDQLEERGVRVHLCPSLVREFSPIRDLRSLFQLTRLFRREKFDVVHLNSSKTGVLGRIAARIAGVRAVVYHVRGFSFHEFSSRWAWLAFGTIEAALSRLTDRVIFVNDEERLWAARWHVIPADRSCTICNGADLNIYCPGERVRLRPIARAKLDIGEGQSAIVFVGRLWEQKNPKTLVPTMVALARRFPDLDAVLLVAGDGPLLEDVQRGIRDTGIEKRVRILGWRSDIPTLLSAADVVFLPSLWEGLPRVLIEAACLGLPAVAANVKGNREVIVDGKTGMLIPPNNPEAAAEALGSLLKSPQLLSAFSEASAERGRRMYDSRETARRIELVYMELLEGSRPASGKRAWSRIDSTGRKA
jgi:glycosyltransferase involved in cell wall biosynthesis